MTEQRLSDARFPTLAVLMVPPATASIAWFGLNANRVTTFGIGLAAVLAMMALIQLFILPDYFRRPFTISFWSFSFPVASTANTMGHWAIAAPNPCESGADLVNADNCHRNHWLACGTNGADGVESLSVDASLATLSRPSMSGASTSWQGSGHIRWFVEKVPAGAA
ncbi:hypothetical protein [Mycobacterium sp.]|uniref:hypothetical protein n=1 Tax=Mycobacterium sp. TaxID=1785 RepID=UPI002C76404D|nr:hypothetical protein [Mycobacterium sp.]HTY35026.1 hypothetical protein [Mycobacterium sp.]